MTRPMKPLSYPPAHADKAGTIEAILSRGYISTNDDITFRTLVEAMRCFGFNGRGWMKGAWKIPDGSGDWLWFPKLYRSGWWHNELVDDGRKIFERAISQDGIRSIAAQIEGAQRHPDTLSIVFARSKGNPGPSRLRYVGTFKANLEESTEDNLVFDRVREVENIRGRTLPR